MAWLIVLSPALLALVGVVMVFTREVWYNAPSTRWAANPAPGVVVRVNPRVRPAQGRIAAAPRFTKRQQVRKSVPAF
jgi:hypothetical protein